MSLTDAIAEFKGEMTRQQKAVLTPGCVWAIVKSVDWNKKTMVCTGVEDGLEYFDVQLGLGSFYRKPVLNSNVMLGVPELQSNDTFLIECEAYEEAIYKSGDTTFVIKEEGFIIQQGSENLRNVLLDFMAECKKIVVVNGTTINVAAVTAVEERLKTILKPN